MPGSNDASAVHHDDPFKKSECKVEVMHHDDAEPINPALNQTPHHIDTVPDIEAGNRFVRKQSWWIDREHHGEQDARALPTR
jgi:hypothetical protein